MGFIVIATTTKKEQERKRPRPVGFFWVSQGVRSCHRFFLSWQYICIFISGCFDLKHSPSSSSEEVSLIYENLRCLKAKENSSPEWISFLNNFMTLKIRLKVHWCQNYCGWYAHYLLKNMIKICGRNIDLHYLQFLSFIWLGISCSFLCHNGDFSGRVLGTTNS